ncbi:MAG: SAM-dependent methyltransferase, partial [Mycobacteriales bacterium]
MSSAQPSDKRPPVGVDPTRASIARVYDAALGGKDNYEIDRKIAAELMRAAPGGYEFAWSNRNFLIRAVRFLAGQAGISQFIDCGSGLPTAENTHQVVQRINPEARVVYVDNDPVVVAHGRALLEDSEQTFFADADIFNPREILDNEAVRTHLDWTEPIALLHIATLHHHVGERHRPAEIMKEYVEALPSGSYVAISHFFEPENEYSATARKMEEAVQNSPLGSGTFRTKSEIEELFPGLEMVTPGVVE